MARLGFERTTLQEGSLEQAAAALEDYRTGGTSLTAFAGGLAYEVGVKGAETVGMALTGLAEVGGAMAPRWVDPTGERREALRDWLIERTVNTSDYWSEVKNARINTTAEQVLFSLGQMAGMAVYAPFGAPAVAGIAGVTTAANESLNALREGATAGRAGAIGAVSGLTMAAGVAAPFAVPLRFGGRFALAQRLGYGVVSNVAPGMVERGAIGAIWEGQGRQDMADRYQALDPMAVGMDAAMGLLLGGAARYADVHQARVDARAYTAAKELSTTADGAAVMQSRIDAELWKASPAARQVEGISAQIKAIKAEAEPDSRTLAQIVDDEAKVRGITHEQAYPIAKELWTRRQERFEVANKDAAQRITELEAKRQELMQQAVTQPGKRYDALQAAGVTDKNTLRDARLLDELDASKAERTGQQAETESAAIDAAHVELQRQNVEAQSLGAGGAREHQAAMAETAQALEEGRAPAPETLKAAIDTAGDTAAQEARMAENMADYHEAYWEEMTGVPLADIEKVNALRVAEMKALEEAYTDIDWRLTDPHYRDAIDHMRHEFDWAERGGFLLRERLPGDGEHTTGDVIGRTSWVAISDVWGSKPDSISPKQGEAYLDKALKGEKLGDKGKRFISHLLDVAEERGPAQYDNQAELDALNVQQLRDYESNLIDADFVEAHSTGVDELLSIERQPKPDAKPPKQDYAEGVFSEPEIQRMMRDAERNGLKLVDDDGIERSLSYFDDEAAGFENDMKTVQEQMLSCLIGGA